MKYFNKQKFKNLNGFTLAEVLITLVIIGIIAALTIPSVINNMQDQQLKSQFAKTYSTITQALNKTVMYDYFGQLDCYYKYDSETSVYSGSVSSQCNTFFDVLSKNLQVQKICKGYAKADGCVPTYQTYAVGSGCASYRQEYIDNINYVYVLSNGQIIITYNIALLPLFLVDINGHKGPNAYGKDLFDFNIKNSGSGLYINSGYCDFPVSGGRTTAEMIQYSLGGKR